MDGKNKTEIGKSIYRISDKDIDRHSLLRFRFINSLRATTLNNNHDENLQKEGFLKLLALDYNEKEDRNGTILRELADKLAECLKKYYTTINNIEVRNCVFNYTILGELDKRGNLLLLINLLHDTIIAAIKTKENCVEQQMKLGSLYENKKTKKYGREDIIDKRSIYTEDFLSKKSLAAAMQLSNMLISYTL